MLINDCRANLAQLCSTFTSEPVYSESVLTLHVGKWRGYGAQGRGKIIGFLRFIGVACFFITGDAVRIVSVGK